MAMSELWRVRAHSVVKLSGSLFDPNRQNIAKLSIEIFGQLISVTVGNLKIPLSLLISGARMRYELCKCVRDWLILMSKQHLPPWNATWDVWNAAWDVSESHRLEVIARALGLERKVSHSEWADETDRFLAQRCSKKLYDWFSSKEASDK